MPSGSLARALICIALLASSLCAALNRETGAFVSRTYLARDYNSSSPQNFAFAQDDQGIIYVANPDGVLAYDGVSWRLTRLAGGAEVRSVAVDKGRVYVGGSGDFGYLQADSLGIAHVVSLVPLVPPADRHFEYIWRILPTPEGVYFSSYYRLFRLNPDGTLKVWRPVSNFGRAFLVNGAVYVKTRERGLLTVRGEELAPVAGGDVFIKSAARDAIAFRGGALIASANNLLLLTRSGVEKFPTSADSYFAQHTLYSIGQLPGGEIAVGTQDGGLVLLDADGAMDRILRHEEGIRQGALADNWVNAIFSDRQGGVWLAFNGGVGLTRFNPGLSRAGGEAKLEGVLCTARQGASIYAGSRGGLYRMSSSQGSAPVFSRVPGIDAAVWALAASGDSLLAATDDGIYQISDDKASLLLQTRQASLDVEVSPRDPSVAYAAGKNFVYQLRHSGSGWEKAGEAVFSGQEIRTVLEDRVGTVWASSPDRIWQIDFSRQPVRPVAFGVKEGVPGGRKAIYGQMLEGHPVFATLKGLIDFSPGANSFAADTTLGKRYAAGGRDVIRVFPDPAGNVWVTGAGYHDLLIREAGSYRRVPSLLIQAGIDEIYSLSLDPDGVAWAAGSDGVLYRYQRDLAGNPDRGFGVLTRRVLNSRDNSILYGGFGNAASLRLPYRANALSFDYAAPFFEEAAAVEYQVFLEGNDHGWSEWSREPRAKYNNLREGSYTFHVRARSPHGAVAESTTASFSIIPPWYRSWWAYSLYIAFGLLGVWQLVRWRTHQLEQDKRRLEGIVEERTVEIRQQRDEIHTQERKSNALLLNILPEKVADELKSTGAVQPVGFDEVTVCFTDFVGFTLSSEKLQPGQLVDALNEYFTAFDEIIAHYGLEKLKTIGDSYMFVSGLPVQRESHAVDALLAALDMAEVVRRLAAKEGGTGWNIRIGLHSGPVVAGVVGIRKFAFDIWGNTVNFAARMESSGVPGRVNMSEHTCRHTRELIDCEFRGEIKIKEGRHLPMYLARGPVADFADRYRAEFGQEPPSMHIKVLEESEMAAGAAR